MADLRQSLHQLVEHPPAKPASVEGLAERARTFTRRRQLQRSGAALLLAAIVGTASLVVTRDGDDGISVAAEGVTSAGYIAEDRGGYIATGTWKLTITRGTQVIELGVLVADTERKFEVAIPASLGDGGAPVLDASYNAYGVLNSSLNPSVGAPYGITVERILQLLDNSTFDVELVIGYDNTL